MTRNQLLLQRYFDKGKVLIKYIAGKKFNNPYSYASIHKTEYYAFNISKDDIDFEKIV